MTAVRPLDWISEIEASLVKLDEKPQFGIPTALNWKQLEDNLQKILNTRDLKITHSAKGWVASNQLFSGLGGKLLPLGIECTPLQSPIFFVTDQQNLKELMTNLLGSEEATSFFLETAYVQAFYNYFAAEILCLLEKQQFASPLTPRLGLQPDNIQDTLGDESCFVIDIGLVVNGKHFWGRVLLSESFRQTWKTYFSHLGPPQLTAEAKEKINVEIGLEVAHAHLSLEEWKNVKAGDFVVLDHCSYDPSEHKGAVVLTLKQKPVFRGRFKDGGIKITNYPIYEEASDAMEDETYDKSFDSDDDDDDLYDDDLDTDLDSEFEEEEEEDIFSGLEPRKKPIEKEKVEKAQPLAAKLAPLEEGPSISATDLPIHLTVEVGKIQMTVATLMNLAPGNLLELDVSPEQGVNLIINGKRVGRGELIRMGEVLGVRILSL